MGDIKGIAVGIVETLVKRTLELSQGRNCGCIGFVNQEGFINSTTEIVDGGLAGLPLRILLGKISPMLGKSILEGLETIPDNSVVISTRPGKTGLITDVGGIDFFNLPVISIGVKDGQAAGVGILYPRDELFDLSTDSEKIDLDTLAALSMNEEKEILRKGTQLSLKYLDVAEELQVVDVAEDKNKTVTAKDRLKFERFEVNSLDQKLASDLVAKSMEVGQGREVAMMAEVNAEGHVVAKGQTVVGGMGYVPSRLLASSAVDITGKSLREIYSQHVAGNAVIVHTHPGGTGVMHIGDANAGPGTWGRPIIAIGHDKDGKIRGATVIQVSDKLFELADEDEVLNAEFFEADTPEREAKIRNRKFGIAQEYTSLCKSIEIK